MLARYRRFTARLIAACRRTPRPLRYATLSGQILAEVEAGRLIRVSTYLTALDLDAEFIARYGSPFGKHVVRHFRNAHHAEPLKAWIRNDAGRYLHVYVYQPDDRALPAAVASYKRTAGLVAAPQLAEAA